MGVYYYRLSGVPHMDETQKAELRKAVEELLAAKNQPNKFMELLFCRRALVALAVVAVVVAKHYGLEISETELITLGTSACALILGHSVRKPSN